MRRLSGLVVAGALIVLPAFSQGDAGRYARVDAQAAQGVMFEGDTALWTVGIKGDKTADFEQVLTKLQEALAKSEKPERKQQAAGWKVVKAPKPLPDGTVAYVHVINPVVKGADYSIMTILYEVFTDPTEQKALYDLYRGAFDKNLGAAGYSTAVDLSKAP
jgi:hypothetical protein